MHSFAFQPLSSFFTRFPGNDGMNNVIIFSTWFTCVHFILFFSLSAGLKGFSDVETLKNLKDTLSLYDVNSFGIEKSLFVIHSRRIDTLVWPPKNLA
jgi:hypothetical protein